MKSLKPENIKLKKEDDEYFQKNIGIIKRLKGNFRAIDQYRKLFNELCHACKAKVIKNPKMPATEYCATCQAKAKTRMQKVKEMII